MQLRPDWEVFGTKEEISKEIGHKFGFKLRLGWTEGKQHTSLVLQVPVLKPPSDPTAGTPRYRLCYWDQPGVRAQMAALIGMPVHQDEVQRVNHEPGE